MATRNSPAAADEATPTPKDQAETGETAGAAAAADGSGVAPADAEAGDKLVQVMFPHDSFGPVVVQAAEGDKKPEIAYTLTRRGVIVKDEHLQAVRDAARASHVKIRTLKAPATS